MEEVRTVSGERVLEDLLEAEELPDLEAEGEAAPGPAPKKAKPVRTATRSARQSARHTARSATGPSVQTISKSFTQSSKYSSRFVLVDFLVQKYIFLLDFEFLFNQTSKFCIYLCLSYESTTKIYCRIIKTFCIGKDSMMGRPETICP